MAALSVQSSPEGISTCSPYCWPRAITCRRSSMLAATPPQRPIEEGEKSSTAFRSFARRESQIAAWSEAQASGMSR